MTKDYNTVWILDAHNLNFGVFCISLFHSIEGICREHLEYSLKQN